MGDVREMAAKFEEGLKSGDFGQMTEMLKEYTTDDFVQEWPQSGERLTKAASIKVNENYPEMSGKSPKFSYKRMLGGGDVFVVEGTVDYGDGVPVSMVSIIELNDEGKIAKTTDYFASPFPAPEWRKQWVEQAEPMKVG